MLFQRLIEYRRFQGAAAWLRDRTAGPPRVFRLGPAPLAPRPEPVVVEFSEDPWQLAAAVDRLLVPPPQREHFASGPASSEASVEYQTSAVWTRIRSTTRSRILRSVSGS